MLDWLSHMHSCREGVEDPTAGFAKAKTVNFHARHGEADSEATLLDDLQTL